MTFNFAPSLLRPDIATCTDPAVLKAEFVRAWGNHDTDRQIAILKREEALGVHKPLAVKRNQPRRDSTQRDHDEEADAHGITTSQLMGRE